MKTCCKFQVTIVADEMTRDLDLNVFQRLLLPMVEAAAAFASRGRRPAAFVIRDECPDVLSAEDKMARFHREP